MAGMEASRGRSIPEFSEIPARLERIVVNGLKRTKDDIIQTNIRDALSATTFEELVGKSIEAKQRLESLGIFKRVRFIVDTCKSKNASSDGYEVVFDVVEKRLVSGSIHTTVETNDAGLQVSAGVTNVHGRAETLTGQYSQNFKQNKDYHLRYKKPIGGNPNINFSSAVYHTNREEPKCGYKERSNGVSADLTFPSLLGDHTLSWDGVWRDLRSLTRSSAFEVREQSGHTLKSCLRHSLTADTRDDRLLPNEGCFAKFLQEYAGLGGNIEYVKGEVELQANKTILPYTVLQLSLAGGMMKTLDKEKTIGINDKFFLGGPLTLRGFEIKGVGPIVDGNSLGSDAYWLGAAHLYTPLPFNPGKGSGFWSMFRSHLFVNAGNLGSIQSDLSPSENLVAMLDTLRMAYGAGVVLRLGNVVRMELNYVVPFRKQDNDSVAPGIQFGVGINFL